MIFVEEFITFFLGSPLNIEKDQSPEYLFLLHLVSNPKFMSLCVIILLFSLFMLIRLLRQDNRKEDFYIFATGVLIVYLGLIYKNISDAVPNPADDIQRAFLTALKSNFGSLVSYQGLKSAFTGKKDNQKTSALPTSKANISYENEMSSENEAPEEQSDREEIQNAYLKKIADRFKEKKSELNDITEFLNQNRNFFNNFDERVESFKKSYQSWVELADTIKSELVTMNFDLDGVKQEIDQIFINFTGFKDIKNNLESTSTNNLNNSLDGILLKKSDKIKVKEQSSDQTNFKVISVVLCVEIAIAVIFLIFLVTENTLVYPMRCFFYIFFVLNILLGVYFMFYAHILDRKCIIGDVPGCKKNFSEDFESFAVSSGIDLKRMDKSKDSLEDELKNFESDSIKNTDDLKKYVVESPKNTFIQHYNTANTQFHNLLFVESGFEDLSQHKVSKKRFYDHLRDMLRTLATLKLQLNGFDDEKIIDFYTTEAIFLDFIKNEKETILLHLNEKINKSDKEEDDRNKQRCETLKLKICKRKCRAQFLFVLLFIGSIFFMIAYTC